MAYKIVIAGGTGFLGGAIINYLRQKPGVEIVVLTRGRSKKHDGITYVNWDAETLTDWVHEINNSTAVINLVGKSVNCRYTTANKRAIIKSRVNATIAIGVAIRQAAHPPQVWINAGSAAIFGNGGDATKDEHSLLGAGFSAEVCKTWEAAFNSVNTVYTRKVLLRTGLVFQKNTGLLQPFVKLVKAGFGGTIGSGKQYISWIHETDFVHVINAALLDENYKGIIHCVSPQPITNKHFMAALRGALHKSFGLPNPSFLVKLGALFIGTEAELVLTGRRFTSSLLAEQQFKFQYPDIEGALHQLLNKNTSKL